MLLSIKIHSETYELLKKIKERDGIPILVSIDKAVQEYAKEKGIK